MNVSELCENTKMARESALLGQYDTSQLYYQTVLQQIQRHLMTEADAARKNKWTNVRTDEIIYTDPK